MRPCVPYKSIALIPINITVENALSVLTTGTEIAVS